MHKREETNTKEVKNEEYEKKPKQIVTELNSPSSHSSSSPESAVPMGLNSPLQRPTFRKTLINFFNSSAKDDTNVMDINEKLTGAALAEEIVKRYVELGNILSKSDTEWLNDAQLVGIF